MQSLELERLDKFEKLADKFLISGKLYQAEFDITVFDNYWSRSFNFDTLKKASGVLMYCYKGNSEWYGFLFKQKIVWIHSTQCMKILKRAY